VKEHEQLRPKVVSEIVCIFVCGHLSLLKYVTGVNILVEIN